MMSAVVVIHTRSTANIPLSGVGLSWAFQDEATTECAYGTHGVWEPDPGQSGNDVTQVQTLKHLMPPSARNFTFEVPAFGFGWAMGFMTQPYKLVWALGRLANDWYYSVTSFNPLVKHFFVLIHACMSSWFSDSVWFYVWRKIRPQIPLIKRITSILSPLLPTLKLNSQRSHLGEGMNYVVINFI